MSSQERQMELAELRAEEERETLIARAGVVVAASGTDECIDCGEPIAVDRKIAAPFARRCLDCQMFHEQERLAR